MNTTQTIASPSTIDVRWNECNYPDELIKVLEESKCSYDKQNLTRNFALSAWNILKDILNENNIIIDEQVISHYRASALEGEKLIRKYEGRFVCIRCVIFAHISLITSYYFDTISTYLGSKRSEIEKKLNCALAQFIRDYIGRPLILDFNI